MERIARALLLACVALAGSFALTAVVAPPAIGAARQHALVGISDPVITGSTPGLLEAVAPKWRAAGIDIASVTADWREIAPDKDAEVAPPGFNGADPSSTLYDWANLDRVIAVLRSHRLEPLLTITGPGPLWSSGDQSRGSARYRPDADLFAAFAAAVSERYSAQVARYIIWTEPNTSERLRPQSFCSKGRCSPRSPEIYRKLFNAAAAAIRGADSSAQVYAGALAARGMDAKDSDDPIRPIPWLRAFACLGDRDTADRSSAACDGFEASAIDGLAFHPDQRATAPSKRLPSTFEVGITDTRRLTHVLDAAQLTGGVTNATDNSLPIDIYYDEWGYQTNPPDVFSGVSLAAQDRWLQQGAKIVYGQPRVKLLGQYLWRDQPVVDDGKGVDAYSGTQSGIYSFDGSPKPAAAHFSNPFWAYVPADGRSARLWGQVRPGAAHSVAIQRRIGRRSFRTIAEVQTDAEGYFSTSFEIRTAATYRYYWLAGSQARKRYSAAVALRPR